MKEKALAIHLFVLHGVTKLLWFESDWIAFLHAYKKLSSLTSSSQAHDLWVSWRRGSA